MVNPIIGNSQKVVHTRRASAETNKRIDMKWVRYDPLKRVCWEHVSTINRPELTWSIEKENWFGRACNGHSMQFSSMSGSLTQGTSLKARKTPFKARFQSTHLVAWGHRHFCFITFCPWEGRWKPFFEKAAVSEYLLACVVEVKGDNTDNLVKDFSICQPDW